MKFLDELAGLGESTDPDRVKVREDFKKNRAASQWAITRDGKA